VVGDFPVDGRLSAFQGHVVDPTEQGELVARAFDVPAIAARYESFLDRWSRHRPGSELPDDLARQLSLHAEWLHLLRQDPLLPAEQLPADWPAIRAERLFHLLARRWDEPVSAILESELDTIRP
jgi:phenylacetic acid degradation operon negative regulatory protein